MAVRILKVVGLLLGVGLLVSPTWSPIPATVCGWAGPQAGEAWYGPPVLTTAQTLDLMEKFAAPEGEKCRLVAGVSLHFGDYEKVFTEAFPILRQYQVPATAFIVTGRIGQPDYMTLDQIKELAKNGWEIGSHTVTHRPLVETKLGTGGLSPSEIRAELEQSKAFLEREGFSVSGFLSPFGLYDDAVLEQIQRVYGYHRSNVFSTINPLPLADHGLGSRWELVYFQVRENTPPQEVIIKIDQVNRRGGWLILDFHDIGDDDPRLSYPPEALEEIVRFIRVGLKLCTLEELQRGSCRTR
jgi:peptidoglycan/xylan/chitin deacetylase (PgdA/CDA1 family)